MSEIQFFLEYNIKTLVLVKTIHVLMCALAYETYVVFSDGVTFFILRFKHPIITFKVLDRLKNLTELELIDLLLEGKEGLALLDEVSTVMSIPFLLQKMRYKTVDFHLNEPFE